MKRIVLTLMLAVPLLFSAQAQRLESFSENEGEFLVQLGEYLNASKQETMEELYKEFESLFKSGLFTEEERKQILKTGNGMLQQRMTASPYFSYYLQNLMLVKNGAENGEERFMQWHQILDRMLADIENRRLNPYLDFLRFSQSFFEHRALRYSESGTTWLADGNKVQMSYEDKQPVIKFEQINLVAQRKQDSISIQQTAGAFYPVQQLWKGQGGKVTWERFGLEKDIYAELSDYGIDVTKGLYEADNVKMHYPLYFGNRAVNGHFEDKLIVSNQVTEGSYPRFESGERVLKLDNIGEGVEFVGGFRLHGPTVYGFGTKEELASLKLFNQKNELVYKGESSLVIIRRGQRLLGDRVESVLYYKQDSIYHPSVSIRFDIATKELQLVRGDRGSDRNPFFSSYHNISIDVETINAFLEKDSVIIGKKALSLVNKDVVSFESQHFYNESDYLRVQNISTVNPLAIIAATAEHENTRWVDADLIARRINSKFTVENITSLIYDLMADGFIGYDKEEQLIEVKDKVLHYAKAYQKKVDYDQLKIRSDTSGTNAILDLKTNEINVQGVKNIEFSEEQRVALIPKNKQITIGENRNMEFDGRLYAGFSIMEGRDFRFNYDKFNIEMDSVDYFDLFIPSGKADDNGQLEAFSIGSRIEHVNGTLLIDAPSNKSGKQDILMFPSFQSKDYSYVYYDQPFVLDGVYKRDSFYFELDKFSFNHLDRFSARDVKFSGKLFSADIFPVFKDTLELRGEDQSLGLMAETPAEGYPAYLDKGIYTGSIDLSNQGLLGAGLVNYLGAEINAEDITFKPKQMAANAENFSLDEDRDSEVKVPQALGEIVEIDWRPYKDSMYIHQKEEPFAMFQSGEHQHKGTLVLSPGGLKGIGTLDWPEANMQSDLLSFGAFSAKADTTQINIRALDGSGELALSTKNVNGIADFDEQFAEFKANDKFLTTRLPYNEYETSMNEFDWDMKAQNIVFNSKADQLGSFLSIHPDQDSLRFNGKTALYDLKTYELEVGGVPHIVTADAFVYPDSGLVYIQPGGVILTLENAKIVADTVNKYHVINRATVDIMGRKYYKASGFYEYNIADKKQEIEFADIIGQRVGKGKMSEKQVITRAKGEVTEEDNFYIDHKTTFQGTISLSADSKNLQFDGFARLDAPLLPRRDWFSVSSEGDKNDLAIEFDTPKNYEGEPLETGFFLSKETARVYPSVMAPLTFRKDRQILPVTGYFKYNEDEDEFIFADSTIIFNASALRGNKLVFDNKRGKVHGAGKLNIGTGLNYVTVDAAGTLDTRYTGEVDTVTGFTEYEIEAEIIAAIDMIIPEPLLKIMVNDIKSSSFDAEVVNYLMHKDFYKKSVAELFPDDEEMRNSLEGINSGYLDLPKKYNDATFFFGKTSMLWDPDYQSFISKDDKLNIISMAGETLNNAVTGYIEYKMPTNEDDRLYIYIKSPSGLYYFLGYKQGILSLTSNNTAFTEEANNLKAKEVILKMDDGNTYEIQIVNPNSANMFVRRVKAVQK